MIKYDYQLERNYGDEIKIFVPGMIPNDIPNLVYIEGPNSSGKSTLLNIIALGFHGLKKHNLNISLKNKLNDLVDSSHQNLKFNIIVTNKDGTLKLVSTKSNPNSPEIILKEESNGHERILTPDLFERHYNLIYDIPDNPTERLNQLVFEISDIQKMYANRIAAFSAYLMNVRNEITRGKDPRRIEALRESVLKGTEEMKNQRNQLESIEELMDKLEIFFLTRSYLYYKKQIDDIQAKEKVIKTRKTQSGKITKRMNRQFVNQKKLIIEKIDKMKEVHATITYLALPFFPKDEGDNLKAWSKIDFSTFLEDYHVDPILNKMILDIKRVLLKQFNPEDKKKTLSEAKVYSDLSEFLTRYRYSDVILPGVDKSIEDFIGILDQEGKKYKGLLKAHENYQLAIDYLNNLSERSRELNNELSILRELKEKTGDNGDCIEIEEDDSEFIALQENIEKYKESLEYYKNECIKKNIGEKEIAGANQECASLDDLQPYYLYNEEQLKTKINEIASEIILKQKTLSGKAEAVRISRNDLDRLEKMEPHKFQDRLKELEELQISIQKIEQKINKDFNSYIAALIKGEVKQKLTESQEQYYDEVAKYLGIRVGSIRHLDQEYKISSIDLISGLIVTSSGKKIKLSDMGTGQSQSAYLTGLLNTDDNRKIIALFDEVAMMDSLSLEPIYSKFRELYEKDKLLIGIVVQKGEEVNVNPIGG
jgi:DNA repair protein SbcC/Rad50